MRLAIVGDAALGWRLAGLETKRGNDVVVLAAALSGDASPGIAHQPYHDRAELDALLEAHSPDVTVVFAPRRGAAPTIAADDLIAAVAAQGARVVVWGCATVYGWAADNNGHALGEEAQLTGRSDLGAAVDTDTAARRLAEERPEDVHLFRAGATLAGSPSAQLAALGRLRLVPTPADRRFVQLLDLRDAIEILQQAIRGENPGVYNVAADGIMRVEDVCRAMGRTATRMPRGLYKVASILCRVGGRVESISGLVAFTGGTPILDNARLKTHFGFRPRYSTRDALAAARDGGRGAADA
ncbi:MAG: hypothetical protein GKS06_18490 [Acidobacteria bacterium]|nr:hypothetical protein [Acidobacteriota bacterium]